MSHPSEFLDNLDVQVGIARGAVKLAEQLLSDHNNEAREIRDTLDVVAYALNHLFDDMDSSLGALRSRIEEAAQ